MTPDKKWLDFLREQYPAGSRIRLREMKDPHAPVAPGTMGVLQAIDDIGTFHVKWENGRDLGLIIGEDSFSVLPPPVSSLKLYMPLTAELYQYDEWGSLEDDSTELDGWSLLAHEGVITARMARYRAPEEAERGLMAYYYEQDGTEQKVRSCVLTVEERQGRLWGVAECRVQGELTPSELDALKEYVAGQAADGWGEGFEQQTIQTPEGELYVHLWSFEGWSIQTEHEQFEMQGPELSL